MRNVNTITMVAILAFVLNALGDATDPSINETEMPSSLTMALAAANNSLGTNVQNFICTSAISVKKEYGGGWQFFFRSRTQNTRYININSKGEEVANNDSYPNGGQIEVASVLSVECAIEKAKINLNDKDKWVAIIAIWLGSNDAKWEVTLVDERKNTIMVHVPSKVRPLELGSGQTEDKRNQLGDGKDEEKGSQAEGMLQPPIPQTQVVEQLATSLQNNDLTKFKSVWSHDVRQSKVNDDSWNDFFIQIKKGNFNSRFGEDWSLKDLDYFYTSWNDEEGTVVVSNENSEFSGIGFGVIKEFDIWKIDL